MKNPIEIDRTELRVILFNLVNPVYFLSSLFLLSSFVFHCVASWEEKKDLLE